MWAKYVAANGMIKFQQLFAIQQKPPQSFGASIMLIVKQEKTFAFPKQNSDTPNSIITFHQQKCISKYVSHGKFL